jgi:hypothetical protein
MWNKPRIDFVAAVFLLPARFYSAIYEMIDLTIVSSLPASS